MSIQVIPEVRRLMCDCCGRVIGENGASRQQSGALHLEKDLLDMQGHACAKGDMNIDLCDDCLAEISKAINATCVAIRAKARGEA